MATAVRMERGGTPEAPGDVLVRARGLTKRFGDFTAVDGIDVDVQRGEAFGFLGPNGAGKSSTMRMIGCVSPPPGVSCGCSASIHARDGPRIRARLGVVPQDDTLDEELTVRENLLVYGALLRPAAQASRQQRADELLDFAQLTERGDEQGRAAVRRHEASADDRPLADQRARHPAARRADDRASTRRPATCSGTGCSGSSSRA